MGGSGLEFKSTERLIVLNGIIIEVGLAAPKSGAFLSCSRISAFF
jgi:hypothetical protein